MRNVFASILAVAAVLGLGSGAVRFAHLTLDHGDAVRCAETSCHHGGGHGHEGTQTSGLADRSVSEATDGAEDAPVDRRRSDSPTPTPMPTTCLLCSVLATHTLGEWPFEDAMPALGRLSLAVVLTDETTLTTRWAEVPAPPRGPPILS